MEREETLTKQVVYEGKILKIRQDTAKIFNGNIAIREVVEHPGGVGIAVKNEKDEYFLVRQFRYGVQDFTWEFPAGKREIGEEPLATAKREVVEEIGYQVDDLQYLGKMYPTPAYDSEIIWYYYGTSGNFVGTHFDQDENLEMGMFTLDTLIDMATRGEIIDAKTIAMIFLLDQKRREKIK